MVELSAKSFATYRSGGDDISNTCSSTGDRLVNWMPGIASVDRELPSYLSDAPDVLVAVLLAEAEVLAESEADVITVETVGVDSPVSEELALELDGNGRFA